MSDEPVPDEGPTFLNPNCTGKNPVKGKWCTARECKDMRALATKAKKAAKLDKACKAVGVPLPAAQLVDVGLCFEVHSVHGVLDCNFPKLGGKQLEEAPCNDPKQLCFLVYGTFAATEDEYEKDRNCKEMLKVVSYKEIFDNCGSDCRSVVHKYAREKSESLRASLKRARGEVERED
jgi:hypothetical protein